MTDGSIFKRFLNKPIFVRYDNGENNERRLVGYLLKIQDDFLLITSRGREYYIRMDKISEFYEPTGEVEP